MRKLFSNTKTRLFYKAILPALIYFSPLLLHAQINKASLSIFQGCGGATLVPSVSYTGGATPVMIYYERLVGADSWALEGTQEYNTRTSFIQYNGSDILAATTFRVRALDEITGNIYISNSVSVNPATWNVDRGTAFSTAFGYWGSTCTNGYIAISVYDETAGRPPFSISYKKNTDATYIDAGQTIGYFQIDNILPGINYNVRVTDACGKVSNLGASLVLDATATITKVTSTCSSHDGTITVSANTDARYSGVAPFTYSVHKYGSTGSDTAFVSTNVFTNLSAGTYQCVVQDACGNKGYKNIVLGSVTPDATATYNMDTNDSCLVDIVIHPVNGNPPFTYWVKPYGGSYTAYTDSIVKVAAFGYYYYKITDSCGGTSYERDIVANAPFGVIDSVKWLGTNCVNDLVVYTNGRVAPYTFYLRNYYFNSYQIVQSSDTFHNIALGRYSLTVFDRCGRYIDALSDINDLSSCGFRTDTGDFESANSNIGCGNFSGHDWIDVHDDKGNLVYSINPNGNTLNNVCWGIHVENNNGDSLRSTNISNTPSYFMDRNFYIEPPANVVLTDSVSIRLYVSDVELYNMLSYLSSIGLSYGTNDLKILKKKGAAGSGVDLLVTDDSTASLGQFTIITPTIVQYGPGAKYLEFKVKDFSEFNPYMGSLSVLATRLLSFNAAAQNKQVQLTWSASADANSKNFEVQWSNTNSNFKTLTTVAAKSGTAVNNYAYIHETPLEGNNFYRLKMVDKNGGVVYSKLISAYINGNGKISIAPNPVQDQLQIQLPAGNHYKGIKVYDTKGVLLLQKTITEASTSANINVQSLARGIYILSLEGNPTERIRFVKY